MSGHLYLFVFSTTHRKNKPDSCVSYTPEGDPMSHQMEHLPPLLWVFGVCHAPLLFLLYFLAPEFQALLAISPGSLKPQLTV